METNELARVHKTRPIGEIFEDGVTGMRVKVVEDKNGGMNCEGCFYCGKYHCFCLGNVKEIGECIGTFRDDNKNIHFEFFNE